MTFRLLLSLSAVSLLLLSFAGTMGASPVSDEKMKWMLQSLITPTEKRSLDMNMDQAKTKRRTLVELAQLGTPEAIAVINDFEKWAVARDRDPLRLLDAGKASATVDPSEAVARGQDDQGHQWIMFDTTWPHALGEDRVRLHYSTDGEDWSKPFYVVVPGKRQMWKSDNARLEIAGKSGRLIVRDRNYPFIIPEKDRDTDQDGLSDESEDLIGTDRTRADSDGDGIPDRTDSNPLTPKHKLIDEHVRIRQAVFLYLYGTRDKQWPVFVFDKKPFSAQEYYGSPSIVLRARDYVPGRVTIVQMDVRMQSAVKATVSTNEYFGPTAGVSMEVHLEKIRGKWLVTGSKITSFS